MAGMADDQGTILLHQIISQQGAMATDISALRENIGKAIIRLEVIDTRNRAADMDHGDYENRLRALERFRYTLAGLAVIGGILAGLLGTYIGVHLH